MAKVDWNRKKLEQLGMPIGTASARLRKMVMFRLIQRLGEDSCYRCSEKITSVDELSIEHKVGWLDRSVELFWDLGNIAFSHMRCNVSEGRLGKPNAREIRTMDGAPKELTWCSGHRAWLPIGRFHKDSSKPTGMHDNCIDCRRERRNQNKVFELS